MGAADIEGSLVTTKRQAPRKQRRVSPLAFVLTVLFLVILAFLYEPPESPPSAETPPTAPGTGIAGGIEYFFTTPSLVYPDRRGLRSDSPLLDAVLADLNTARNTIDLAVFDLDLIPLGDALRRAERRGVLVRVVLDSENLETPEVSALAGELEEAGIALVTDGREPFMHNKFIVIDGRVTWTGSWNMTENDTYRNNNNMLRFDEPRIADYYIEEFAQMSDGLFGAQKAFTGPREAVNVGRAQVRVFFSPKDRMAGEVVAAIGAARRSVRFLTFSFTSDPIADAMIERARAGVQVTGVFERQNASGTGSEFGKLRDARIDVLEDGNCYILHHKVIIIDERVVITGSYNFTASAETSNDENLLIIDDPALAQAYVEEFERLYAQASSPTRCG
jgi:phosphatidylserine/phosphatidylglycerophosphate/cardiolipin synthase-like enzyme